jgi:hypothetical protein
MEDQGTGIKIRSWQDLMPEYFVVGTAKVPVDSMKGKSYLQNLIPPCTVVDDAGVTFEPTIGAAKPSHLGKIVQVKLDWKVHSNLELIRVFLSATSGKKLTSEMVLQVAQSSPAALEAVKGALKEFKEHLNRLCNPIALRRDPAFVRTAQMFREKLKVVADELQAVSRRRSQLTAQLNKILAERDKELHRLDPAYVPKRLDASSVLRQYGLDVAEAELQEASEELSRSNLSQDEIDRMLDF